MELAEPFATKFRAADLTLIKTPYWSVLIRQQQVTIGSLVLAANRSFISAAELSPEEAAEFPGIVGKLESALSTTFHFDRINYLCLMMVDRHYHFHVLPRYETPRSFERRDWVDSAWPKPPLLAVPDTDPIVLSRLRDYLLQNV